MSEKILFAKTGSEWNTDKAILTFPYRAYEFIEFFKLCEEEQEIIGIEINTEGHCLSFIFQKKEK